MSTITCKGETTFESKSGREHDIKFSVECGVENDGIGPFEYWGCKGNDKGSDYLNYEGEINSLYLLRGDRKRKIKANEHIQEVIGEYVDDHADDIFDDNTCWMNYESV